MRSGLLAALALAASLNVASAQDLKCGGARAADAIAVSRAEARCPWAFTVDRVELACLFGNEDSVVLVVRAAGRTYPLNGDARQARFQRRFGYRDNLEEIWAKTNDPGRRVDITDWIDAAFQACPT